MIEGVEILSQEIIYNTTLPEACIAVAISLMIVFLVVALLFLFEDRYIITTIFGVLSVGSLVLGGWGCTENKDSVHHIEYKVTIDNSVSMTEFMDKYEIIDQEGKIYTVKERE